jgi:hypothetical protein
LDELVLGLHLPSKFLLSDADVLQDRALAFVSTILVPDGDEVALDYF